MNIVEGLSTLAVDRRWCGVVPSFRVAVATVVSITQANSWRLKLDVATESTSMEAAGVAESRSGLVAGPPFPFDRVAS